MSAESVENAGAVAPPEPLVAGTLLLERYTVVRFIAATETANEYLVAVTRACPMCGVENQGDAATCGFCGSALPEASLLRLFEQRAPRDARALPPASFVLDDFCYTLAPNSATAETAAATTLQLTYGSRTDTGLARSARGEPNEDSVAVVLLDAPGALRPLALFMIADGVGGAAAGEVASRMALQTLTREWTNRILLPLWNGTALTDETVRAELQAGLAAANAQLVEFQNERGAQSGTTLTALVVLGTRALVVNIGDSRTYLWRDQNFAPLTRDHSYVGMLVANGLITPMDAYYHPQRNIILASLGDAASTADIFPLEGGTLELRAGDQWLLCSDGLWEMARDDVMQHILSQTADAQAACAELTQKANAAGGADNISVIIVRFDSDLL